MCEFANLPSAASPKLRSLPLLTEVNITLLNLAFAILHFVLAPTGLEPVAAALVAGNLFGIVLPYLGVICLIVHFIVGPIMGPEVYQSVVLDHKLHWTFGLFVANIIVAVFDSSHRKVEGSDYRGYESKLAKYALKFWISLYTYIEMDVEPWCKDARLDPNRQFIFACHPHGIHCFPLGLFHNKGSPFDERFPGICGNISGLAATVVFKLPGVREFFLSLPYIDASRPVAEKALKAERNLFVCTGSGEESLLTTQGEDILVLSRRKGFIRLAMAYGCAVVPVFGLGNNDLFVTYPYFSGFRMWLQKKLHVSIPLFRGRFFTPLPFRTKIKVVIGEPLVMPKPKVRGKRPDEKDVEKFLQIYIERVKELHKNHGNGRKLTIR
mmetsp:Transcript_22819/g.51725  ORF Transcript_22819/g.51725 Transcript_22819/m.51725 type:complete len:381 (+) Transcript_22819:237-1379(+)